MNDNLPIITPLSPALGAEVTKIDLSQELSSFQIQAVKSAFAHYSVLVFPNQHIDVNAQKRFAKNFGELWIQEHLKDFTIDGHPECMRLHNDDKKPPGLNYWHTDNSGWETPPLGTMLYAKITPDVGGDTLFSNMYLAYERLSPPMQNFLKQLYAVHDVKKAFGNEYTNLQNTLRKKGLDPDKNFAQFDPVKHPLVRTHPDTHRNALYVSYPYVTHIDGLTSAESQALLTFLYRHIETQEFIYRHRWKINDLVMWDNRCTQHYAAADYYPKERLMYRLNISGERPFFIKSEAKDFVL